MTDQEQTSQEEEIKKIRVIWEKNQTKVCKYIDSPVVIYKWDETRYETSVPVNIFHRIYANIASGTYNFLETSSYIGHH